ncbi:MAG: phage terminase small subunit P27 family [Bellilinea sp.]
MAIGRKSGGKHWTRAEVESRQKAADGIKRPTRVTIRMPGWLDENAQAVWKRVRKQIAGLDLLDNVDAEMLAIYCDAVARYSQTVTGMVEIQKDGNPIVRDEEIKAAQSWARIVAAYADKLGLSPASRARLAKKRADEDRDPFGEAFD